MYGYSGGPVFSPETQTEKGIRGLSTALIIYLVASVLSLISSLAAIALLGQIASGAYASLAASAIGLLALTCGALALYLVVIILAIIGFFAVHKGKMEYGPAHESDVNRAFMLLIAAIIFFFSSIIMSFVIGFYVGLSSGTSDLSILESPAFTSISSVLGILFSLMVGLILYYIIKAFLPPERKNTAIAAVILYTLSPVLSYVLGFAFNPATGFIVSPSGTIFDPLWFIPSLIGGLLSLIALLIFLVLYRDVVSRLKSRQFKPVWDTAMQQPMFQAPEYRWQPPPSP